MKEKVIELDLGIGTNQIFPEKVKIRVPIKPKTKKPTQSENQTTNG